MRRTAPDWLDLILARGLPPISGGDGTGGEPPEGEKPNGDGDGKGGEKPSRIEWTDEQHEAIKKIVAKEAGEAARAARKAVEAEIAAKAEEEKKARERDEAAKRGEFDTVRSSLESERDAAKAERDSLKARLDAIDAERKAAIESGIREFPKDLPALAFDPGADADLDARWRWFVTAQKQAGEATKAIVRGNGRNPTPLNGRGATIDEERRALAKTGQYNL